MSLGRFGGAYAALHAGHTVADYWAQTDFQARAKGKPGEDGRRACAAHVATLTATQAAFLGLACLTTGERLNIRRVTAGLAVNAASETTHLVAKHFDEDVAKAITGDTEPFEAAARNLGHAARSTDDLDKVIKDIAARLDDGLADWLVDRADSPGAWFFAQVRDSI